MPRNLYLGIDLGTTNSVAAWTEVSNNGTIITQAVDLRVLDENKREAIKSVLPSCVYFKSKDSPPFVGEFARKMISTKSSHVVKSVKSLMGTGRKINIDGKEFTPSEISSIILKEIAISSKQQNLGTIPDDAVITVPASFDTDQCADTNEAARRAGFRVTEDDGSPRYIFLREPVAALYDFLSRQDSHLIPTSLDLSEPKVILVFDIGGGTLDISLHEVTRNPKGKHSAMPYDIKPIAVSRHTLLGGDNFDALLSDFFISKIPNFSIDSLNENQKAIFRSQMINEAERAKIYLNTDATIFTRRGEDYSGKVAYSAALSYIGNTDKSFEYDLTAEEYKEIISPYLAPDLTMESLDDFESLSDRTENIIYPILDLLDKAKRDLGHVPEIDAVIMNGGMSKLFAIRERIRDFFGFEPLEILDPDLAVARGASVYHYWRHLGIKTSEIQNDDIGIAVKGGKIRKLILAGTPLPFMTGTYEFVIPESGLTWLDLPFYRGTGQYAALPNRRIASRRIRFSTPQKAGTPINIQAVVDEAGTLNIKVWNPDRPNDYYPVENIYTDKSEPDTQLADLTPPGGFKKAGPAEIYSSGRKEDIESLMKQYAEVSSSYNSTMPSKRKKSLEQLKIIETRIETASNCGEAVEGMSRLMMPFGNISDRAARMLGRLARAAEGEYAVKAAEYLRDFCSPERVRKNLDAGDYSRLHIQGMAIQALSILRRKEDEKFFLSVMSLAPFPGQTMERELCYALGRTGHSEKSVNSVAKYISSSKTGERIAAYWALGRIASRENKNKCPASCLEKILPSVFRHLGTETHCDILRNGIYAVGEMCDQRITGEKVSAKTKDAAEKFLAGLSQRLSQHKEGKYKQAVSFMATALSMIQSEELSSEQKENLLDIRMS